MVNRLRSSVLAATFAALASAAHPAQPDDSAEGSRPAASGLSPDPISISVILNGERLLPAPGSAAGIWFYAHPASSSQLLLTGHTDVPGSWRLTTVLGSHAELRLTMPPSSRASADLRYTSRPLSLSALNCRLQADALILSAVAAPGGLRLAAFTLRGTPASFAPERRPFSREPAVGSPDLHPAIAEALVEWDWRMQDGIQTPHEPRTYREAIEKLLIQTGALVAERIRLGNLTGEERAAWETFRAAELPSPENPVMQETRWLELHRLRRRLVLANPLFRLPSLLFVKHVPSVMSHQLTQNYGYCARPGGGLFELVEPGTSMSTRNLTPASLPAGNFMTPELSYDAQRLFFAYCPVKEAPASWDFNEQTRSLRYHLYELSLTSGNVRRLTDGDTDNFSPVLLPSDDIVFLSTARGGYHRCGRGPCFVYTLARMGPRGENPRNVSFHETHEWDPCLLNDGRVIYTRWDYVDRNAVHYQQLWSAFPDGGGARIYYGNNTWNPTGIWEARPVPGSSQIMATAGPHHGLSAGSIVLVDPAQGVDGLNSLARLTPDVRFPESESPLAFGPNPASCDFDTPISQFWQSPLRDPRMETQATVEEQRWPGHCYKSPWPLSESFFIVAYSFDRLLGEPGPNLPNMFGLYFADAFGNKELIYRDPAISSVWARPLVPRPPPPTLPSSKLTDETAGIFFLRNVREGWPGLPHDTPITHLRVIQVLLKTTPNADSPPVGAAFAAPGKQVLGNVPVETDGSARFKVPAQTPVLFQALDGEGRAVQTMRSLVYLQPGEQQSCIGCHEHRMQTAAPAPLALALRHEPSTIQPGPEGSHPLSYPRLVQPVLDRHCLRCHDGREADRPVLTGEPEGAFTKSYNALVKWVSFSAWGRPDQNFEPLTPPLRFGALGSPLTRILEEGHGEVSLTPQDKERLYTWMDANALFYGTFDVDEQRKQLAGQVIAAPRE